MLQWIVILTFAAIVLRIIYLIVKRTVCLTKIKRNWKWTISYLRNPFISVFLHDGKFDLLLKGGGKEYFVSIFTTPFRKVRYHFLNDKALEIIIERRAIYIGNHKAYGNALAMDRCYTLRKYNIGLDDTDTLGSKNKYLILNPSPRSVTKVSGNSIESLCNNDILFNDFRIMGLKYFLEEVI